MTVTFRLRFRTQPGQSLWLQGHHPLPGHPLPMQYVDQDFWQVTVPLTTLATGLMLNYSYLLSDCLKTIQPLLALGLLRICGCECWGDN
jgi:hypothetical protein